MGDATKNVLDFLDFPPFRITFKLLYCMSYRQKQQKLLIRALNCFLTPLEKKSPIPLCDCVMCLCKLVRLTAKGSCVRDLSFVANIKFPFLGLKLDNQLSGEAVNLFLKGVRNKQDRIHNSFSRRKSSFHRIRNKQVWVHGHSWLFGEAVFYLFKGVRNKHVQDYKLGE